MLPLQMLKNIVARRTATAARRKTCANPAGSAFAAGDAATPAAHTTVRAAASSYRVANFLRSETRLIDFKEGAHQGGRGYFLDRRSASAAVSNVGNSSAGAL